MRQITMTTKREREGIYRERSVLRERTMPVHAAVGDKQRWRENQTRSTTFGNYDLENN